MYRKYLPLLILLVFTLIAPASASIIISDGPGMALNNDDVTFMGKHPTYTSGLGAGEFEITGDFSSPAYCIDYLASLGSDTYTLSDPFNYDDGNFFKKSYETSGQYAVWLMDTFAVGLGYNPYVNGTQYSKNESAAALQLAIWDAIYDFDGRDFDNGSWTTDSGGTQSNVFTYSNSDSSNTPYKHVDLLFNYFKTALVDAVHSHSYSLLKNSNFKVVDFDTNQDLLAVVPEPATLLLFGLGLLGISAIGRKRKA